MFHAHGKLLLTAEYFVLDGATALALPTRFGQELTVETTFEDNFLRWKSFDEEQESWFEATLEGGTLRPIEFSDIDTAQRLEQLLQRARHYRFDFLGDTEVGHRVETRLDFPRNWGLGTSSTLVHLVSQWAKVDPFRLQFDVFGGSGYDIACAGSGSPLLYRLHDERQPNYVPLAWEPEFSPQIYFVYLGKKQNSRDGIARYRERGVPSARDVAEINELTTWFLRARTLGEFQEAMYEHEKLVGKAIDLDPVQWERFSDFPGQLKSLGAWGGDFIMVADERPTERVRKYFAERGLSVFLRWRELFAQF